MKPQTRTFKEFLIETALYTVMSQINNLTDEQINKLDQSIKEQKKNKVKIIHL